MTAPQRSLRLSKTPINDVTSRSYTSGEIFYDETNQTLVVYDGKTVGGHPLLRADLSNTTAPVASVFFSDTAPTGKNAGAIWINTLTGISYVLYNGAWVEPAAQTFGGVNTSTGNVTGNLTGNVVGNLTGNVVGNVTGVLTGNASTATKLLSPTQINGINFDGSTAITVSAAAGTLTGTSLASNIVSSSLTSVGVLTSGAIGTGFTAIPNSALANNTVTINGTTVSLGGSATVTSIVAANTLTGTALPSSVVTSSLTSVGTLGSLTVSGATSTGTVSLTSAITTANNAGAISYGTLAYTDTNIFSSYTTAVNSYAQKILQNTSSGAAASVDFIVSNNLGTSSTYYGDFGMNSSTFTGTGSLNLPNAVYMYSANSDLVLGTSTSNAVHFVVNGGATDAATINSTGTLVLNNGLTIASGLMDILASREGVTDISATGATILYALTSSSSTIFYHAVTPTSNWTAAISGLPTDNGKVFTIVIMVPQGATPYAITALSINAVAQSILWIGATGAPSGNANKTDMWSFTLIRRNNTWVALGIQSGNFG